MKKDTFMNDKINRIRLVRSWIGSFGFLVVSAILFIFCFIFERALWLYAICFIVFLIFVCTYIRADKAIRLKDGYSLIQAMHFYLVCLKADADNTNEKQRHSICEIAKRYEYANNLKPHQVEMMYRTGSELIHHFKLERLNKYV